MRLDTRNFGELDIDESKIIEFKSGIPGYPQLRQFILLSDKNSDSPEDDQDGLLYWLQSVEDKDLAFVMVDMVRYNPSYDPRVSEDEIAELGNYDPETFCFYNIAVLPENMNDMTVNLKAPVVINSQSMLGKQVICENEEYTVRHYMFK